MRIGRRRRRPGIDTVEIGHLQGVVRRTALIRLALAAAVVALLAAAAASARNLHVRERALLPSDSTGIVVLDLSLSIAERNYGVIRGTIRKLAASDDAPIGLVVFSDVPYELLPPGTPASELRPLLRLLEPRATGVPVNPWWQQFRAGTRISFALQLAGDMLERDHVSNGAILLVSDLETAPEDVPALTRELQELRRERIDVRIVPISPSSDGVLVVTRVLGRKAFAAAPDAAPGDPRRIGGNAVDDLPTTLLVLAGILFAVLALHEVFAGRLALPRPDRRQGRTA